MSDAREAMEMMRKVAKTRIDMLKNGVTFHDESKRKYYLREYSEKLRKIEEIIRRMNLRLVHGNEGVGDKDPQE